MLPRICPSCGAQAPRLADAAPATCLKCRAPIPSTEAAGTETETPHERTAYRVGPYKAVPGGPIVGVILAGICGLVVAVVLAGTAAAVRPFIWIALLFSGVIGYAIGVVIGKVARVTKVRSPGQLSRTGAFVGLVCAVLIHYFGYRFAGAALPQVQGLTFLGYIDFMCKGGVRVGSVEFGYWGTLAYFVVDALFVIGLAFETSGSGAADPFCADCGCWKQTEELGPFKIDDEVAVPAFEAGTPAAMVSPTSTDGQVSLVLFRCPHCGDAGELDVKLKCVRGGRHSRSMFLTYPGAAASDFEEIAAECRERGLEAKT